MKVKMITDAPGSPDGIRIEQYEQGHTYDVPGELGDVLVAEGLAAAVAEKGPVKSTKRAAGPSENK